MSGLNGSAGSRRAPVMRSADEWSGFMADFELSGLSQREFCEFRGLLCVFTLFKGVPFTFFDGICVRFCPRRGSRKRFRLDPPGFCAGTGISNGARGLGASGFRSRFTMESAPVRL